MTPEELAGLKELAARLEVSVAELNDRMGSVETTMGEMAEAIQTLATYLPQPDVIADSLASWEQRRQLRHRRESARNGLAGQLPASR